MGKTVGASDGDNDGRADGASVGNFDGAKDGTSVGIDEGTYEYAVVSDPLVLSWNDSEAVINYHDGTADQ